MFAAGTETMDPPFGGFAGIIGDRQQRLGLAMAVERKAQPIEPKRQTVAECLQDCFLACPQVQECAFTFRLAELAKGRGFFSGEEPCGKVKGGMAAPH